MTREELKNLGIEDEAVEKILSDYAENYISKADGAYIPKSRLDEVIKERDTYKTQVGERDTQLKDLEKQLKDGDVEKLQQTITQLQKDNKTAADNYAAEIKQIKTDNYIEKALIAANSKNNVAVKALLAGFLAEHELDDKGEIAGLSEEIEKLKTAEDSSFMFKSSTGSTTLQGKSPEDPANKPDGKVDFSKMTYSQQMDYLSKHPDAQLN